MIHHDHLLFVPFEYSITADKIEIDDSMNFKPLSDELNSAVISGVNPTEQAFTVVEHNSASFVAC